MTDALQFAKIHDVTIFAIGIGNEIKKDMLVRMAGSPSRVLSVASYRALPRLFRQISSKTCEVPQNPVIGTNTTDVLPRDGRRYYAFIMKVAITLQLDVKIGNVIGYYSYTDENPSAAVNDGEFRNGIVIPPPSGTPMMKEFKVFVTIEGHADNNVYTLGNSPRKDMRKFECFEYCNKYALA